MRVGWGRFFNNMALTPEQEHLIIDNARRFATSIRLENEDDFYTAVQQQLANLDGGNIAKRRNTIIGLGEAAVNPEISRNSVFKRSNCVSEQIFYDTRKDWLHGQNFRQVLENVLALYRAWEAIKQLRVVEERQNKWREDSYVIGNNMAKLVQNMLGTDLYEVMMEDDDGRQVTVMPAKWAFRDTAPIITAADKLIRLSLDMPTDKQEIDAYTEVHEAENPRESARQKLDQLRSRMIGPGTVVEEPDDE